MSVSRSSTWFSQSICSVTLWERGPTHRNPHSPRHLGPRSPGTRGALRCGRRRSYIILYTRLCVNRSNRKNWLGGLGIEVPAIGRKAIPRNFKEMPDAPASAHRSAPQDPFAPSTLRSDRGRAPLRAGQRKPLRGAGGKQKAIVIRRPVGWLRSTTWQWRGSAPRSASCKEQIMPITPPRTDSVTSLHQELGEDVLRLGAYRQSAGRSRGCAP